MMDTIRKQKFSLFEVAAAKLRFLKKKENEFRLKYFFHTHVSECLQCISFQSMRLNEIRYSIKIRVKAVKPRFLSMHFDRRFL